MNLNPAKEFFEYSEQTLLLYNFSKLKRLEILLSGIFLTAQSTAF